MRSLVFIVAASVGLSGCALFGVLGRGAAGAAARGAMVEMSAARAAGATFAAEATAGSAGRAVFLSSRVAATSEPAFGTALTEVAAGRSAMLIDGAGVIRTGSQRLVNLQGRTFYVGDEAVAYLEHGTVYDLAAKTPIARLRGTLDSSAIPMELSNGRVFTNSKPLLVDVIEMQGGRYLIRTPAGQETWVPAGLLGLGVLSLGDEGDCIPGYGGGVLIRHSGEPLPFYSCETFGDAIALSTDEGRIAVASEEVSEILYGQEAVTFAYTGLARTA